MTNVDTAATTNGSGAPTPAESVSSITIQGMEFEVPQPYTAGTYELTAGEASALNQTLAENLRNNFAPRIKAVMAEYRKANGLADDAEVPLASLDQDSLAEEFAEYAKSYEFGVRRAGGVRTPSDPVEREAQRIATDRVRAAFKEQNVKISSVPKEKLQEIVTAVLAKYPEIREEAKRRTESAAGIVLSDLGSVAA